MSFSGQPRKVIYQCTALVGTNKTGDIKPDADGYYTLVVGGLNAFNSANAFYPADSAKPLFENSSGFQRRIKNGNCKGECGHPKPLPGQSNREFLQRVLQIEETRVACHFRKIWLEEQGVKDSQGRPITAIMAEIKPSGPMGPALKESLENPHENVCFSIRSLTQDRTVPAGYLEKNIKQIISFDWVTEPGISAAHKYNAPSLESFDETTMSPEHLDSIESQYRETGVSLENSGIGGLREMLGWDKSLLSTRTLSATIPASANW